MRRPRVNRIGAIFFQLLDTFLERPTSIDNIVNLMIEKETREWFGCRGMRKSNL